MTPIPTKLPKKWGNNFCGFGLNKDILDTLTE